MPDSRTYTIGWICALHTEYVAAKVSLDDSHGRIDDIDIRDTNHYTLGQIGPHSIAIAILPHWQYGLVNAAAAIKDMVRSFPNLRFILMVGVGGGAPTNHDIRLGDVVISSAGYGNGGVFQYDYGHAIQNRAFKTTGYLNQPPITLLKAINALRGVHEINGHGIDEAIEGVLEKNPRLRKKYQRPDAGHDRLYQSTYIHAGDENKSCADLCGNDSSNIVRRDQRPEEDRLGIHYGLIASANQVLKDAVVRDNLAREKDVICFEMEAAGLMNHFPCLVIRGISDYCDTHKNVEWQGYAALAAAAYARQLLYSIPRGSVEVERKIGEAISELACIAADTQITVKDTSKAVEQLSCARHYDQMTKWLSPPDPSTNYNRTLKERHTGTGQWLLNDPRYMRWKEEPGSFLWLHGIPGCGKTVLSTTVVENLKDDAGTNVLLYFYFAFSDIHKQSFDHAMRSLALQLYGNGHANARNPLDECFSLHRDGQQQPSLEMLCKTFQQMAQLAGQVWIVLDALDECKVEQRQRQELLEWIRGLHVESNNFHLLVTSRQEHSIKSAIGEWARTSTSIPLQGEAVQQDIASYICEKVRNGRGLRRWHGQENIQQEIVDALTEKANGMFRWVTCQLDTLETCFDYRSVQEALRSLPETLDATYDRILKSLPKRQLQKAIRLLQFLTYSERPLKINEAVDILAVDSSQKPRFDVRNRMPNPMEISEYCPSLLITVRKEGFYRAGYIDEIQLSHFSVKEYILSNKGETAFAGDFQEAAARAVIAETCLAYLLELDDTILRIDTLSTIFPLARFAAMFWTEHAAWHRKRLETVCTLAIEYLTSQHIFGKCWQLYSHEDPWKESDGRRKVPTALYYASLCGLHSCVEDLVRLGSNVNNHDGHYGTALQAASSRGHFDIVQFLLEQGADVNAEGGRHGNALQAASSSGHFDMIRLFSQHKANVTARSGFFGDALQAASANGHLNVVDFLLKEGADVNSQGGFYGTALHAAVWKGDFDIIKLLLQHNADIHAQCGHFGSTLQAALSQGHVAVALFLIEANVDINAAGGNRGNALQAASSTGNLHTVQLLLRLGANIHAEGGHAGSALQAASNQGHLDIVRLLLEEGAKVDAQGGNFGNALQAAVAGGHLDVVKILLEHKADINAQGGEFGSALQAASAGENQDMVRLLLRHGAAVNAEGGEHGNALEAASYEGTLEIIQLLLEAGADSQGRNPKQWLEWAGREWESEDEETEEEAEYDEEEEEDEEFRS